MINLVNSVDLIAEKDKIIEYAKERKIVLKLMGALAFRTQCPDHLDLFELMKRDLTDIDFVSLSKENEKIIGLFKTLGYQPDKSILASQEYGTNRHIFHIPNSEIHVDIFFDELKMCHIIDFRNRLNIEEETISLSDMLLEKMQIVEINEKDIIDSIILLLQHQVGSDDFKKINKEYISQLMANDWGFYYTFTTNMNKIKSVLNEYRYLSSTQKKTVIDKVDLILQSVEEKPKALKWKIRSKIGTKQKWYNDVDSI